MMAGGSLCVAVGVLAGELGEFSPAQVSSEALLAWLFLVIFGSLMPQPTEEYPHWFGLNAYAISHPAQTMLLRVLSGAF